MINWLIFMAPIYLVLLLIGAGVVWGLGMFAWHYPRTAIGIAFILAFLLTLAR
jgi:hypothetical protein